MKSKVVRFRSDDLPAAVEVLDRFGVRADREHLGTFLRSESQFFVAASVASDWVGFAYGYELLHPAGGSTLFLYSIDVLPDYRRQGIASELISALRSAAEAQGMKELFVFTNYSNVAAIGLYNSTGGVAPNGDDLLFVFPTAAENQID